MLDKCKHYGVVSGGESKVAFFQNGRYYDHDEDEVTEQGEPLKMSDRPANLVDAFEMLPHEFEALPDIEVLPIPLLVKDSDSFEPVEDLSDDLAWQTVKKKVEGMGGVWTNKAEGLNYLRSL